MYRSYNQPIAFYPVRYSIPVYKTYTVQPLQVINPVQELPALESQIGTVPVQESVPLEPRVVEKIEYVPESSLVPKENVEFYDEKGKLMDLPGDDPRIDKLAAQNENIVYQQRDLRNSVDQIYNNTEAIMHEQSQLRSDNYYTESKARQIENYTQFIMGEAEKLKQENMLLRAQNIRLMNEFEQQKKLHSQLEERQRLTEIKQQEQEEKQRALEQNQANEAIRQLNREKMLEKQMAYQLQREKAIERQSELERINLLRQNEKLMQDREQQLLMMHRQSLQNFSGQQQQPTPSRPTFFVQSYNPVPMQVSQVPQPLYMSVPQQVYNPTPRLGASVQRTVEPAVNSTLQPAQQSYIKPQEQVYPSTPMQHSQMYPNQNTVSFDHNPKEKLQQAQSFLPNQAGNIQKQIHSDVIKQNAELEMLQRKLNKENRPVLLNLLFKASVDGDSAQVFHKKCDYAQGSIVLIETTGGRRFGGYTSQSWAGDKEDKKDNKAFVFSLDNMEIYDIIPDQDAIGCYPKYGPVFFGCQIRVYDNFFIRGGTTYLKGLNYLTTADYVLTGGEPAFGVKELEVFEVNFG